MDTSDQDDGLLKTLFKESFQETWKDSPDFALYLAELSASSLEKLSREPERLAEEKAQILEQTEHLAFHNYKTFIKTAECSKEIFHDFVSVESHVESLLDKLPRFSETCSNFMKAAQEINSSRHLNSLTLARHTQLLEILEISQLMDSCVRNGYYEEALELSSYVHRLEKKLSNIPIIQNIVEVVQSSTQLMLSQLLQQLRSAIQLPACLRVIGYLRRLDMFSESELRIKFLQARDAWLQSVLASIPSDDPYYHITKTIETSRVHLFDIVTQYRAIFSDDDPILSMENEDSPMYSNLFHCWVVQKVQQFLKTLEYDLERGVGSRLDSLLGQCMYFGLSFSRVGADFRGLLPPLFHTAAMKAFSTAVLDATERFNETMKSYSPQSLSSSVTATMLSTMTAKKLLREMGTSFRRNDFWDRFGWASVAYDWFMVALNTIDQSSNEKSLHSVLVPILLGVSKPDDTGADLHPPSSLLQHPPLAAFTNSVLSAFNELRHCAPLAILSPVTEVLQSSFASVIHVTCAFHRAEAAALNESERATFANFCQVLGKQLIPYINRCLEAIFPSSALSVLQGGPTAASTSLRLDVKRLNVLLEPVMPQESTEEEEKLRGEQDVKSRPSIPQDTTGETEQPRHENEAEREKRKEQKNTDQEKEHLTEQSVETESLNDGGEKVSESEQQEPDLT